MIRAMVADNIYYPADGDTLRSLLQRAFHDAAVPATDASVAVAPYGAYSLTLPYLAASLRAVSEAEPECVLLLAPPNASDRRLMLLPESDGFATPFGTLPVASDITAALRETAPDVFLVDEIAHLQDHSIETTLPALHYLFGPVPVVPVLVGDSPPAALARARDTVESVLSGRRWITFAAANLSGFVSPDEADARARKLIRPLMTSRGESILERAQTVESPPRSMATLILAHLLAGAAARPEVLGRGTFETEYEGDVGSVVFASIAYLPM